MDKPRKHWVLKIILLVIGGFIALNAYSYYSLNHYPKGFLVPTDASIPKNFELMFGNKNAVHANMWATGSTGRGSGYYFQYDSVNPDLCAPGQTCSSDSTTDLNGPQLFISELTESETDNYEKRIQNLERSKDSPLYAAKVRDITYMGLPGVIYHTASSVSGAAEARLYDYELLLHDGDKVLRIEITRSYQRGFTDKDVEAILHTFVRQQ